MGISLVDPFGAIADILVGWHKTGVLTGWLKLIFGIGFSYFITFNTITGGLLAAKQGWQMSVGGGMLTASAMALLAYLRANQKLTSGIVIAVPQKTVEDQIDSKGSGPEVITASGKP